MTTQVVAVIGHACAPGALVMITLKSLALAQSAVAAAAAKLSALGVTNWQEAFFRSTQAMEFFFA